MQSAIVWVTVMQSFEFILVLSLNELLNSRDIDSFGHHIIKLIWHHSKAINHVGLLCLNSIKVSEIIDAKGNN